MARPLRVNRPDGWYHAYGRGLNRMELYLDDGDRDHFLELLEEVVGRYRVQVHAYVLMGNHFHVAVRTPDANLSRAMQWLSLSYAAWFNARHRRTGPVFQRPFGSVPVQDAAWIYELSLYIHLNPLRIKALGLSKQERKAGRVGVRPVPAREEIDARMRKVRGYAWSSFRAYAGYEQPPGWLTTGEILKRAGPRDRDRVSAYRKDARRRAAEGGEESKLEALRDRIAIGGATFVRSVKDLSMQGGLGRETSAKRELRSRIGIEEVFSAVAEDRGEPWEQIADRHRDPGKAQAMWLARRCTGLTLREIGQAMGGRDYAAVAMAIRRFDQHLHADKALAKRTRRLAAKFNVKMSPL